LLAENLKATTLRKIEIEHQKLGKELVYQKESLFSRAGDADVVAAGFDAARQSLCHLPVVFDDQDTPCCGSLLH